MKKKIIAMLLAAATAVALLASPATEMKAEAAGRVGVENLSSLARVSISTPQETALLYSGMTWEQLDANISLKLQVEDSTCSDSVRKIFTDKAAKMGVTVVNVLDTRLYKFNEGGGWKQKTEVATSPIRVAYFLPAGADTSVDYAVISIKDDGTTEVLGDLDNVPTMVTVDTSYFRTVAIVAGKKGAFAKYLAPSDAALNKVTIPTGLAALKCPVNLTNQTAFVRGLTFLNTKDEIYGAAGKAVSVNFSDATPLSEKTKAIMDAAVAKTNAKGYAYFNVQLKDNIGRDVIKTARELRIAFTTPVNMPAYADYAVAVLDDKGGVKILKDLDDNDATITVDVADFRVMGILWGVKGSF